MAITVALIGGAASVIAANKGTQKAKGAPEFVMELSEKDLTKIVFIRYAPGFEKEKPCNNDGICDADERNWCSDCKSTIEEPTVAPCYDFLAKSKPRWNWLENYYYNDSALGSLSAIAVNTWENVPNTRDIFGNGLFGSYTWGVYDYNNSVSFANYPEEGVLGVTAIWFRGKNIYEYDIMYDTDYFPTGSFDLPTAVLHEMGHAAGLGDLYDTTCIDNVMYGYLSPGQVKTTPIGGDIIGLQTLYGN